MHNRPAIAYFVAFMAIVLFIPHQAFAKPPLPVNHDHPGTTWVDFNEDGYVDYVVTDPETGHLNWFMFHEGDWQAVSGIEAVDPWRLSVPEPRSQVLRAVLAKGDDPQLFAITWDGRLRVVDTETGFSANLGSIASFQERLFPNALTSVFHSTLTVFSRHYYEGHLYNFHPVTGNLLIDYDILLPEMLNVRGIAASDKDTYYAVRFVSGGLFEDDLNELWLLRPLSQTADLIGLLGDRFHKSQSLALSPDGVLYGWSLSQGLMWIDSTTGRAEFVDEPIPPRLDIQALAFGPDGTLYGGRENLYRIDSATGMTELIGPTAHGQWYGPDIRGLAFARAKLQDVGFGLRGDHCPARFTEYTRGLMQGFIAGSEDLDVSRIETSRVRLAGDLPVEDVQITDVATRPEFSWDCCRTGADGIDDLVFYFDSESLIDLLWPAPVGEADQLEVSARTVDGTLLFGSVAITWGAGNSPNKSDHNNRVSAGLNAYPNPFNPRTTFSFNLESPGNVSLLIYDHRGRLVRTLAQGFFAAGDHQEIWNGRDNRGAEVSSGSYRALLRTPDGRRSIAVLLLR